MKHRPWSLNGPITSIRWCPWRWEGSHVPPLAHQALAWWQHLEQLCYLFVEWSRNENITELNWAHSWGNRGPQRTHSSFVVWTLEQPPLAKKPTGRVTLCPTLPRMVRFMPFSLVSSLIVLPLVSEVSPFGWFFRMTRGWSLETKGNHHQLVTNKHWLGSPSVS